MDHGKMYYEGRYCLPSMDAYIRNLTSSYTDKSNEGSMVSATVIMFVLAGLFFNLNLFGGISDVSATLDPKVRLFLSSALSLFLLVMSYLFSEAKNAAHSASSAGGDLSRGAELILLWMLLVELLRKKVDEIRMSGYSGTIQRAGRVVWLGNLVFFNIRSAGRKAVFGVLWILCATRVVQRIAYTEIGKHSYAHGKNARLITSYMAQMLQQQQEDPAAAAAAPDQQHPDGDEVLRRCRYIVMGEEKMVQEPTADGYAFAPGAAESVVTMAKVWKELADTDELLFASPAHARRLKRLCLSFALFKLLRRHFERLLPEVTEKEARISRDLILRGLYGLNNNDGDADRTTEAAEAVFQVVSDEVNFLGEYYHSVVPVVLASPFFLAVNYFLVLAVVAVLCAMTVILCGNGDVRFALRSVAADNYTLQSGIGRVAACLVLKATTSASAFFSAVYLCITVLLIVIYLYEEVWEFLVFLLSNWFMVSLLCDYAAGPARWRESAWFAAAFRRLVWVRSKTTGSELSFRQFSVLNLRWPLRLPLYSALALAVRREPVPRALKKSVMDYLVEHDRGTADYAPLTNGKCALRRNPAFEHHAWACAGESVAEVILTWYVATAIVAEQSKPAEAAAAAWSGRVVTAVRLSRYCAYLVAFRPELLPGNAEKTEKVIEDAKAEMRAILGRWDYYLLSSPAARAAKIVEAANVEKTEQQHGGVVRNGARLGRQLLDEAGDDQEAVWKMLADVWTELIVFVAPASDEERVKAHEDVLVQGGEFITVLWALTTHTGVSREAGKPKTLEELFGESMRVPCTTADII